MACFGFSVFASAGIVAIASVVVVFLVVGVGVVWCFFFAVCARLVFEVSVIGCSFFFGRVAMKAVGFGCSLSRFRVVRDLLRRSGFWFCLACNILCGFRMLFCFSLWLPVLSACAIEGGGLWDARAV